MLGSRRKFEIAYFSVRSRLTTIEQARNSNYTIMRLMTKI